MKKTIFYVLCILLINAVGLFASQANPKKSILVVSFGTTHLDALSRAIEPVEKRIMERFKEYEVKRAFTSSIVRKRLAQKGINVQDPSEALASLAAKGCKEVYVQPLLIIPGAEFHELVRTARSFANQFEILQLGYPLLTHPEDFSLVARILNKKFFKEKKNQCVILMGHGTHHPANSCYALLQTEIKRLNSHLYIATVEGSLSLEHLLVDLPDAKKYPVVLAPFMLVAGDHAKNDLAGDDDDSWRKILEKKGFQVYPKLIGLGEDPLFQEIFVEHLEKIISSGHE
jgi:sirohydrochlorin cobaltochelatase